MTGSRVRTASVLALGVFALHQLRYLAGYGNDAGDALAAQGHGYLSIALPAVFVLFVGGLGAAVLERMAKDESPRPVRSGGVQLLACMGLVLAGYCGQELAEGVLATGHPQGLAAILAHTGWIAAPLAVIVGAFAAFAIRAVAHLERRVAIALSACLVPSPRAPRALGQRRDAPVRLWSRLDLAFGIAGRAPPAFLLSE